MNADVGRRRLRGDQCRTRVVVTSKDSDGVSRVKSDGPAAAAISLASLGGVGLAYPLQVRVHPVGSAMAAIRLMVSGPLIPPRGSLNFFQLYFSNGLSGFKERG